MNSTVAVLMAGGLGTRLWPWSVRNRPKQFLPLLGERSLVRMTADRVLPLTSPDKTLLLTNGHLIDRARENLPELPAENLIGEPRACNTAPCVALAAAVCEKRWGTDAVMIVLAADHYIGDDEEFRRILSSAMETARKERCLVTIGIPPTRPETGYGYLECEKKFSEVTPGVAVPLTRFREKPNRETALAYLSSGRHLWNMGNFVWRCDTILAEFERHMPDLIRRARKCFDASGEGGEESINRYYNDLPESLCTSIDFGIMEKADDIRCIPCPVPWDDVGSWSVLRRLRKDELDDQGNLFLLRHLAIETENTIVAGTESPDGLVVTVGVEGLVIIRDGERVLVVDEDQIDLMRRVVPEIRAKGWEHLL